MSLYDIEDDPTPYVCADSGEQSDECDDDHDGNGCPEDKGCNVCQTYPGCECDDDLDAERDREWDDAYLDDVGD